MKYGYAPRSTDDQTPAVFPPRQNGSFFRDFAPPEPALDTGFISLQAVLPVLY